MLTILYGVIGLTLAGVSTLPVLGITTTLLFIGMMCMGMGNGAVFQLVPQRFRHEVGTLPVLLAPLAAWAATFCRRFSAT